MPLSVANQMASDWLALRAVWSQVPVNERVKALAYFQLSEANLMSFTRAQLITAFTTP